MDEERLGWFVRPLQPDVIILTSCSIHCFQHIPPFEMRHFCLRKHSERAHYKIITLNYLT